MNAEDYMRQASMTSRTYLSEAHKDLEDLGLPYTAADVIALAAVSAQDFQAMWIGQYLQRIAYALETKGEGV